MKRNFTAEEIIKITLSLGSEDHKTGSNGELIFQTICHNKSSSNYKLYYYPASGLFHCYTGCGDSFNIYELVKRNRDYNFAEAQMYIKSLLGIDSRRIGFMPEHTPMDEWDIFDKYALRQKTQEPHEFKTYPKSLIHFYKHLHPAEWVAEGILPRSLDKFQIRYDLINNKIIIPHFDKNGNLIGIRGRALNKEDIERGAKYMPVTIEGEVLKHATSYNLYGLHRNKKAIQTIKKIMIFEAEKSVLKCDGFYGKDNFTVACCGSTISNRQRDMIIELGVNEVFIAFDKERLDVAPPRIGATKAELELHTKEMARREEHNRRYLDKLYNLAYKFCPYVVTYLVCDDDEGGLLEYQDAPCDKGREVFEHLMKNKLEIMTKGENDEYAKQWRNV